MYYGENGGDRGGFGERGWEMDGGEWRKEGLDGLIEIVIQIFEVISYPLT
jgi:hypothetical protein